MVVSSLICFCINRNIVECKYIRMIHHTGMKHVLIETLWNVNKEEAAPIEYTAVVLIETLWNVNKFKLIEFAIEFSINRNIVECKFFYL